MTDNEKIQELSQKISYELKDIFLSENFMNFLKSVAIFHHYSLRNLLLIRMQYPNATRVAEYEEWKQLDRYVKRGEKGITIVKPGLTTFQQSEENKTIIQYAVTRVYDISQTEGKPVPENQKDLQADNEQLFQIFQKLSPYKNSFLQTDGEEKCRCNYTTQTIAIKLGLTDFETVQAFIRGVCHAIIHTEPGRKTLLQKQVESECTAFIVSHSLGFDTSFCNFDFVAEWSKTAQLDELYQALDNIQKTANQILKCVQDEIHSLEKTPEKSEEKSPNLQSRLQAATEKINDMRNEKELNALEKSLLK